jgi:hypothetical protein
VLQEPPDRDPGSEPIQRNAPRERPAPRIGEKTLAEKVDSPERPGLQIPTEVRSWKSLDGRVLSGRVTELNKAADTVTLERSDGQIFRDFPISKLDPADASFLRLGIAQ